MRRISGKEALETKAKYEDIKRLKEIEQRRKEAEDDKRAKEAIRKKLEQDKLERQAKQNKTTQPTTTTVAPVAVVTPTEPTAKKEYTESLIQLRFPDGNIIKATFKPTDTVRTVHDHVSLLLNSSKYNLVSNFPKKVWAYNDKTMESTTLQAADCVPTGTFIVSKP